ncbi:hypothetical protein C0995_008850 [Termitomyces sp. Mi166|nr:hypothetical protein C0995_008850 [Termitomyces sp. Mi166\
MAWHAPNTTALKPTATNLNDQHWNNLKAASTLLQGLNPSEVLFEQAAAHESKPHTFASDQAQVVFATSYYPQGIALDHYTIILHFNLGHPLFTNWQAFVNKFSSKFSMFDMVTKAERKLMFLRMSADKCFTTFIVQFEKEAYKTGWNYNALRFQLSEALPQHIHDVLQLAPKQPMSEDLSLSTFHLSASL